MIFLPFNFNVCSKTSERGIVYNQKLFPALNRGLQEIIDAVNIGHSISFLGIMSALGRSRTLKRADGESLKP